MSAGENSDLEKHSCDLDELIEKSLSAGPKAPDELFKAVMKKTKLNERTYYLHLKKLLNSHIIEEVSEKDDDGRIIKKYTLKASTVSLLLKSSTDYEDVSPSRRYLKIAAWLKREPEEWPQFEAIRKSKLVMKNYAYLIPAIEASCEDPDRYAFVWSDEACYGQRFGEFVQSRFFRLRDVYRAIVEDSETDSAVGCGGLRL